MRVRVVRLVWLRRRALVDGERVRQPFLAGELLGKAPGEVAPRLGAQFVRERELNLPIQPPVGALMLVRRRPVGAWVVLRPRGHVAMLHMLAFLWILLCVAALALDVVIFSEGRLPTGTAADVHLKVIHSHFIVSDIVRWRTAFRTAKCV